MKSKLFMVAGSVGAGLALVLAFVSNAYATADSTAVDSVSAGALTLKDTLVAVATAVLPYAAAIAAITVGWRMARRFVH